MAAEVSFLRKAVALPKINAEFPATIDGVTIKGGVKITLTIAEESLDPDVVLDLSRAMRDGIQTVVLVSQNRSQEVPGTESMTRTAGQFDAAKRAALGIALLDDLMDGLMADRDPGTGYIEADGPRTETPPLASVGTYVGGDAGEVRQAVEDMAEADPHGTAEMAGRASRRSRRGG